MCLLLSVYAPCLTSISSASLNRVSDSLTSSASLTRCIPHENSNITKKRLQKMESNISSLGETLNRFIETHRISREQVRNEGRYSTRLSPIREKYKGFHRSRSPQHRRHHIHCQPTESPISLAASQCDINDGSESEFVYHNPPLVTENKSISSHVREATIADKIYQTMSRNQAKLDRTRKL